MQRITASSLSYEICRWILAHRIILWSELKVATTLDTFLGIIKHKSSRDIVQWLCGFGYCLQIAYLSLYIYLIFFIRISRGGWIGKLDW